MGTSLYVIISKPLVARYSAVTVTAWAYICGAVISVTTAIVVNSNEAAVNFVAPDIAFDDAWTVPSSAVWPLAYWIVFNSCVAYGLITFVSQVALDFSARACGYSLTKKRSPSGQQARLGVVRACLHGTAALRDGAALLAAGCTREKSTA